MTENSPEYFCDYSLRTGTRRERGIYRGERGEVRDRPPGEEKDVAVVAWVAGEVLRAVLARV